MRRNFSFPQVNQTYMWYAGMSGNNSQEEFRASGAYIFRPDGAHAQPVAAAANVTIVQGVVNFNATINAQIAKVNLLFTHFLQPIEIPIFIL